MIRTIFRVVGIILGFVSKGSGEPLTVICPHKNITFEVEVPQTPAELQKGLMFRENLAEESGMLFVFPHAPRHPVAMWMKNTPLSLDMLFIDSDGKVLEIFEDTLPYSEARIGPVEGTAQVLEIKAGLSKKHGITKACRMMRGSQISDHSKGK